MKIELKYEPAGNMVEFAVTNRICNDVKFAVKDITPFKQFKRDKYEQQGSGLGLYLSKLICEKYKGSLRKDYADATILQISARLGGIQSE